MRYIAKPQWHQLVACDIISLPLIISQGLWLIAMANMPSEWINKGEKRGKGKRKGKERKGREKKIGKRKRKGKEQKKRERRSLGPSSPFLFCFPLFSLSFFISSFWAHNCAHIQFLLKLFAWCYSFLCVSILATLFTGYQTASQPTTITVTNMQRTSK